MTIHATVAVVSLSVWLRCVGVCEWLALPHPGFII